MMMSPPPPISSAIELTLSSEVAQEAMAAQGLALAGLQSILTDVYELVNDTAVLIQELQRETSLNADELLTLATIATANLQRWHRTACRKTGDLASISLVPASQSSLARATGTPRQTMRRRLEKLAAMGTIRHLPQGVMIDFSSPIILALMQHLPGAIAQTRAATANDA